MQPHKCFYDFGDVLALLNAGSKLTRKVWIERYPDDTPWIEKHPELNLIMLCNQRGGISPRGESVPNYDGWRINQPDVLSTDWVLFTPKQ